MKLTTTRTAALVFSVCTVAACGSSSDSTTESTPFHAIPEDAVTVSGSAACDFSDDGVSVDGEPGMVVVCELAMTDARVSGTETHDRFRSVVEGPGGYVWVAEQAVITSEEGTWRGSVQAAEDDDAIPSGEAHYVGEGAYEGLEFHYYFFHADLGEAAEIRGWVTGGA